MSLCYESDNICYTVLIHLIKAKDKIVEIGWKPPEHVWSEMPETSGKF